MIGRNVEQDGDIGTELIHIVELKTAQFDDIPVVVAHSHLISQTLSDISSKANVVTGASKNILDK
jgi:hypothetical protein